MMAAGQTVNNDENSVKQEAQLPQRYPNVTLLYFATPLALNAPDEGFPWDDLGKILQEGQRWLRCKMAKKYC